MPSFGIFGHYGNYNLGDEAIIAAVIENVRLRSPDAVLYCFSINPQDTQDRYGLPSFPVRRLVARAGEAKPGESIREDPIEDKFHKARDSSFTRKLKDAIKRLPILGQSIRMLLHSPARMRDLIHEVRFLVHSYRLLQAKKLDILMVCGSNQFLDNWGGAFGFPYTLLKWSVLARLAGAKLAYVSVGAGPLEGRLSRFLAKQAASLAHYVSFRDQQSEALMRSIGFKGDCVIAPDLAHSLPAKAWKMRRNPDPESAEMPLVAINPMPVHDRRYWPVVDDDAYHRYRKKMATFVEALRTDGWQCLFFATQPKDELVAKDVIADLRTWGPLRDNPPRLESVRDLDQLMEMMAGADLVVATRFHGSLLPLLIPRPVLAICYHQKTYELMERMGQGDYAVDLDTFTVEDLLTRLRALWENRETQGARITRTAEEYRQALDRQYDRLLDLASGTGPITLRSGKKVARGMPLESQN